MVDIPGIPNAIEKPILEQLIKAFIKACPLVLPEGVFNKLVAGEAGSAGVEQAVIRKLNEEIYIPLISRETQNEIVETMCNVFFTSTGLAAVRRQMVARSLRAVANDETRGKLASELNAMVDIPILNEDQEQALAEKFIDMCVHLLDTFIPAPIRKILDTTSPDELKEIRNTLVKRLGERIDLPWSSKESEEKAIRHVVDSFLAFYGLQDGTKNADELLDETKHELKICAIKLEAHQENSYDTEQKMLAQIAKLKQKEKQLSRELHGRSWTGFLKFWKRD